MRSSQLASELTSSQRQGCEGEGGAVATARQVHLSWGKASMFDWESSFGVAAPCDNMSRLLHIGRVGYCSRVPSCLPLAPPIGRSYVTGQYSIPEVGFSGFENGAETVGSRSGLWGSAEHVLGSTLRLCAEALQTGEWEGSRL